MEAIECLEAHTAQCAGPVKYRMALSGTGASYPRCDRHWEIRVQKQDEINRRYPALEPSDFDPAYAGERWDEDF